MDGGTSAGEMYVAAVCPGSFVNNSAPRNTGKCPAGFSSATGVMSSWFSVSTSPGAVMRSWDSDASSSVSFFLAIKYLLR